MYHSGSGDTHLLGTLAVNVMDELSAGPATLTQLKERISPPNGTQSVEFTRVIEEALLYLKRLFLVETQ